jgi:hypothetical protein
MTMIRQSTFLAAFLVAGLAFPGHAKPLRAQDVPKPASYSLALYASHGSNLLKADDEKSDQKKKPLSCCNAKVKICCD